MSDFFTVIVSNDDCVSLGMSIPHAVSPKTVVPSIIVQINLFRFIFVMF